MSSCRWMVLAGAMAGAMVTLGGACDGEEGGAPDAGSPDAPGPTITACPLASGFSSTVIPGADLMGQTRTHLYALRGGIMAWPKPFGAVVTLAPLEPLTFLGHVVSEEMIFSTAEAGATAQITTYDGAHFTLPAPDGERYGAAAAAPGGALYVATRRAADGAGAVYRVRAATRTLEPVLTSAGEPRALQATDGALYWLRGEPAADAYAVIELELATGRERVLLAEAPRLESLHVSGQTFFVIEPGVGPQQHELATGELQRTFGFTSYAGELSIVSLAERVFLTYGRIFWSPGTSCPAFPSPLFELREGEGPQPRASATSKTVAGDGVIYSSSFSSQCCQLAGGSCWPEAQDVICYRP